MAIHDVHPLLYSILLSTFFVILNHYTVAQEIYQNNETNSTYDKKDFKKWFAEIKDFYHDDCKITSASSVDSDRNIKGKIVTTPKLLNVVRCSTGKGKWNYRAKVRYMYKYMSEA